MTSPDRADGLDETAKTDVCIIGAGPAGLRAAICAAHGGASTILVEANATTGRKLLVTGGGRCNFTHTGDANDLLRAFGKAGRFLRHAFHEVQPEDVIEFFRSRGIESVVEPDGSVFPATLGAPDIRAALLREGAGLGVRLLVDSKVTQVAAENAGFSVQTARRTIAARRLIIATGGVSWPQTGSTGDGYRFAQALGHTVTPARACLVPLVTAEAWPGSMAGVSMDAVVMKGIVERRKIAACGSMLFTHDGISGPAGLDLSWHLADSLHASPVGVAIQIDLVPTFDPNKLDQHLQEQFVAQVKKSIVNVLTEWLPRRLSAVLCGLAGCDAELQAGQVTKESRRRLASLLKELPLSIVGTRPIAEATVTRGGVSTHEIDPLTMRSKIHPGLFFAGEVIDVDGPCGGYNLHACWATGTLAGHSAARIA
jgi:predicted Rossmann fold flavoprotein